MRERERELFAPRNLLESCQGLQELIATSPPDEKDRAGADAKNMITEDQLHYHGAIKLEVRTLGAYALPDGLTSESHIWPALRFGELQLRGRLAQVAYMRVNRIHTLAWMMVDAVIREDHGEQYMATVTDLDDYRSASDPEHAVTPTNTRLARPLYVPVGMIESVLVAA